MKVELSIIGIAVFILGIIIFTISPTLLIILLATFIAIVRWKFASIKGAVGEWFVNGILRKLDPNEYHVYHDLYIPTEDGTTSQVDHVVTSRFGIFVVETKHYTGWIYGSEKQRYWTQVIYKRKEKLFNPIWQNKGHIEALSNYLTLENKNYFHSIIAFSQDSTLKFEDNFPSARVIQFPQLRDVILEKREFVFGEGDVEEINQRLDKLIVKNPFEKRKLKQKHVEAIKRSLKEKQSKQKQNKEKVVHISRKKGFRNERKNTTLHTEEELLKTAGKRVLEDSSNKETPVPAIPISSIPPEVEIKEVTDVLVPNKPIPEQKVCPKCNGNLVHKRGKYGAFYGCSSFPKCRYTSKGRQG